MGPVHGGIFIAGNSGWGWGGGGAYTWMDLDVNILVGLYKGGGLGLGGPYIQGWFYGINLI